MGKIKNSYFGLAFNDLRYLLRFDPDDEYSYNKVTTEAQQVVEKVLKGIIEKCDEIPIDAKAKLLGTHNLRMLGIVLNKHYEVDLSITDLAYLKDFYFEARYHGDDFIEATRLDRDKCMSIVKEVLSKLLYFCDDVTENVKEFCNDGSLKSMDAF